MGLLVLLGLPIALYGSRWYTSSLTNHVADELTQLALLAGGFHYFWTRLQRDPVPTLYPQYVTTWLTFADIILDGIVPVALTMSPSILAGDYYSAVAPVWARDLLVDQYTGAGILWFVGDIAGLPFLLLSLRQLMHRDKAHAAEIDTELDQLQAEEQAHHPSRSRSDKPATMRPWWEDDPYLAEHFGWNHRR